MFKLIFLLSFFYYHVFCMYTKGKWTEKINETSDISAFDKISYANSKVFLKVHCNSKNPIRIKIEWLLRLSPCAEEYLKLNKDRVSTYWKNINVNQLKQFYDSVFFKKSSLVIDCQDNDISLNYYDKDPKQISFINRSRRESKANEQVTVTNKTHTNKKDKYLLTTTWVDGSYLFLVKVSCVKQKDCKFKASIESSIKGYNGYLAAVDWPLVHFYAIMCIIYAVFAFFWLIFCMCYWQDLLRVQFWIGAVVLLALLEKAFYYAEYEEINIRGKSIWGAVIVAEIVSCLKRGLSRILVVVVCVGYGIVKPRLGETMKKIVCLGLIYLVFALAESMQRALSQTIKQREIDLYFNLPLAVIDALIFVVSFSYLLQTIRQMRTRKNIVKFNLYRRFSNVLLAVILASIVFSFWSYYNHKLFPCIKSWNEVWLDVAFWHILFCTILGSIMWLWRPSKNNVRYAYSPILDSYRDDVSDSEEEYEDDILMDTFSESGAEGLTHKNRANKPLKTVKKDVSHEDSLKWIEENIPASIAETALPLIDSDEEITTKAIANAKME